ncbi:hypothetical protein [Hansschlegelia zhihuaiae]|uniref:Uncharacterized protein n=1 Tax=Hansschlegelia zhihuaiae TaxID=405005 RepID=A0A4Q0ML53_9HYPH|nr:hypothetical protein [Hansschlegelia zhihuaiae]RXF74400.1 hypothetical protein EK403_06160 [Hansschlegelia zhihuaiae]
MAAVLPDRDFDALVETLHALTFAMVDRGEIDRWQIRVALGEHRVLPSRAASEPSAEEGLSALLRAIRWPSAGADRPFA